MNVYRGVVSNMEKPPRSTDVANEAAAAVAAAAAARASKMMVLLRGVAVMVMVAMAWRRVGRKAHARV